MNRFQLALPLLFMAAAAGAGSATPEATLLAGLAPEYRETQQRCEQLRPGQQHAHQEGHAHHREVQRELGEDIEADPELARPRHGEAKETEHVCEKCGSPMLIRSGRFGRFMACSAYPECKTTKKLPPA